MIYLILFKATLVILTYTLNYYTLLYLKVIYLVYYKFFILN